VVGLGNPGEAHAATRHNAGFRVLDALRRRHGVALAPSRFRGRFGSGRIEGVAVGLLEPQTFMNDSGEAVAACLAEHTELVASRDCLVVYDDLDLPPGRIRLRARGGAGGHRGLASVIDRLATADLDRLRVGIGRPPDGTDPVQWVLAPLRADEDRALADTCDFAADAVESWLREGIVPTMDRYNRPPAEPVPSSGLGDD